MTETNENQLNGNISFIEPDQSALKAANIQQAKTILEEERKQRIRNCNQEINEVLKKYNCTIQMIPAQIQIATIPE